MSPMDWVAARSFSACPSSCPPASISSSIVPNAIVRREDGHFWNFSEMPSNQQSRKAGPLAESSLADVRRRLSYRSSSLKRMQKESRLSHPHLPFLVTRSFSSCICLVAFCSSPRTRWFHGAKNQVEKNILKGRYIFFKIKKLKASDSPINNLIPG